MNESLRFFSRKGAQGAQKTSYVVCSGSSTSKGGIKVEQQHPIKVYDEDGTVIGNYLADLFVEDQLIIELKAVKNVADEHVAQILGYLKSSRIEHGLLINFGSYRFHIKNTRSHPPALPNYPAESSSLSFLRSLRSFAASSSSRSQRLNIS
jgi:GxxExxY protein